MILWHLPYSLIKSFLGRCMQGPVLGTSARPEPHGPSSMFVDQFSQPLDL